MDIEVLVSLHRHWVWADRMKELFEFYLKKEGLPAQESLAPDQPYMLSSMFTCMFLWYGLLYATCDGIEEVSAARMSDIAPTYDAAKKTLRRFRNAMFHVQPCYWTPKLMDVLKDGKIVEQIRATHVKVGQWLETQLKRYAENTQPLAPADR